MALLTHTPITQLRPGSQLQAKKPTAFATAQNYMSEVPDTNKSSVRWHLSCQGATERDIYLFIFLKAAKCNKGLTHKISFTWVKVCLFTRLDLAPPF